LIVVSLRLVMRALKIHNGFRRWLLIIGVVLSASSLFGQADYSWWNKQQNWDGVTHWSSYMIFSPYYFGPNALNVPFSEKGRVKQSGEVGLYSDLWVAHGDQTQDVGAHLYLPVVGGLIGLEAWGVALEHYALTNDLGAERRVRNENANGTASGDAYFAAVLAVVRDRKFPDVAVRFVLRTASGGKLSDARYTDAPGYYFDVSAGKNFVINQDKKDYFRAYAMLGFYSWQMNLPLYRQDDAVLFGAGGDVHLHNNVFTASIDGYWGYLGKKKMIVVNPLKPVVYHDQPVVWRLAWAHRWDKWKLGLRLQGGVRDHLYTSVQLKMTYLLPVFFHLNEAQQ
jgi:hypothetical protein